MKVVITGANVIIRSRHRVRIILLYQILKHMWQLRWTQQHANGERLNKIRTQHCATYENKIYAGRTNGRTMKGRNNVRISTSLLIKIFEI